MCEKKAGAAIAERILQFVYAYTFTVPPCWLSEVEVSEVEAPYAD